VIARATPKPLVRRSSGTGTIVPIAYTVWSLWLLAAGVVQPT
jgi:hypothetical protein